MTKTKKIDFEIIDQVLEMYNNTKVIDKKFNNFSIYEDMDSKAWLLQNYEEYEKYYSDILNTFVSFENYRKIIDTNRRRILMTVANILLNIKIYYEDFSEDLKFEVKTWGNWELLKNGTKEYLEKMKNSGYVNFNGKLKDLGLGSWSYLIVKNDIDVFKKRLKTCFSYSEDKIKFQVYFADINKNKKHALFVLVQSLDDLDWNKKKLKKYNFKEVRINQAISQCFRNLALHDKTVASLGLDNIRDNINLIKLRKADINKIKINQKIRFDKYKDDIEYKKYKKEYDRQRYLSKQNKQNDKIKKNNLFNLKGKQNEIFKEWINVPKAKRKRKASLVH